MKYVATLLFTIVLASCSGEPGHLEMDRGQKTAMYNGAEISYEEADLILRETGSPKTTIKMIDGALEVDGTIADHRPLAVMVHRITTMPLEDLTPADLEFKRKVEEFGGKRLPAPQPTKLPDSEIDG